MKRHICFSLLLVVALQLSAKYPVTKGETDPVLMDLDPYMIEALRGDQYAQTGKIPRGRFGSEGGIVELMQESAFVELVEKHDLKLFNGPMLGSVSSTSAKIWLRTAGPAKFQLVVEGRPSEVVETSAETDFTGIATVEGLKPFTEYHYGILLDGEQVTDPSFHFTTYPKPGSKEQYAIAFGACSRYQPKNEPIWRIMAGTEPLAYLGLGDNLYIDAEDRRDVQRLHYYRRMLRAEYREFIAQTAMYATWDDHDFGENDSAGGPGLIKPWKLPNFKVFAQNWNNPSYGTPDTPGTWHSFVMGDVEVFMLDGRMYRTDPKDPSDTRNTMLGEVQKQWLLNALKSSTAKFKVLASSTMWHDLADKKGRDSWAGNRHRAERDEIYALIDEHRIGGVIQLSGDRHRTEVWKTERADAYPLYEFVSSKVTNEHTHPTRKEAKWSYNQGNFWGELEFDFTKADPTVTFRARNQDGAELHAFEIKLTDISFN
ncbi:MAG: alkaline phosphatase D family protein [Lentimonas sp.]